MIAILYGLLDNGSQHPISFVHGANNSRVQAFGSHLQEVAEQKPNVKYIILTAEDSVNGNSTIQRHPSLVDLSKLAAGPDLLFDRSYTGHFVVRCRQSFEPRL